MKVRCHIIRTSTVVFTGYMWVKGNVGAFHSLQINNYALHSQNNHNPLQETKALRSHS